MMKCPFSFKLSPARRELLNDLGILILRLSVAGLMLISHGWGKLVHFSEKSAVFPDPLGVGSSVSLALVVGAEVFCSIAIMAGFATRLAAIPLIVTMLVAILVIHADDPWQKKEFALMYLLPFVTLVFTGAGRFSFDRFCSKKCR